MCTDRIQDPKIALLFERIEQKVDRQMKTPKDFEYLSECIFETLHQRISSTTLKRMWGYVPESVKPRTSTLNLLAQFVGAENWEAFCQQEQEPVPAIEPEPVQAPSVEPLQSTRSHTTFKRVAFIVLPLLVIAGLLAVFFLLKRQPDIITFADAEVKRICVENWDTDHDGELSAAEAAAVTSLGKVFRANTTITSFNELQFFTGLTDINKDAFSGCENLKSIIIPDNVNTIGNNAFWNCIQMKELYIPKNVISIFNDAACNAFSSMPELISIIVDEDNPVYDSRNNCLIETASKKLVVGCRTTVIPDDVLAIGDAAFLGCWHMESIDIPANVTQIGNRAFSWCCSLKCVVCHWSEPISFGEKAFEYIGGECTLIVPKGTRAAYIAAGWTEEIFTGGIIETNN